MFTEPAEHLNAELRRLTFLLHREVLRLRAAYHLSHDEFRGLYVSDEQVDRSVREVLGAAPVARGGPDPAVEELTQRAEALRASNAARLVPHFPWARVATEFGLSAFEQDVLLLATAPEVDLKYEAIYAYLNNDVTRKWPTFDLALRVCGPPAGASPCRRAPLLPGSTLFGSGLLRTLPPPAERPAWLATGFAAATPAALYLMGLPYEDANLFGVVERLDSAVAWGDVPVGPALRDRLRKAAGMLADDRPPLLVFGGRPGTGRRSAAAAVCGEIHRPLLGVNLAAIRAAPEPQKLAQAVVLQRRLLGAGLYLTQGQALIETGGGAGESTVGQGAQQAFDLLTGAPAVPVFLAWGPGDGWRGLAPGRRSLAFSFDDAEQGHSTSADRRGQWARHLGDAGVAADGPALDTLADRFRLTPGQIREAVCTAVDQARLDGLVPEATDVAALVPVETLAAAARGQSDGRLAKLASKAPLRAGPRWADLILPKATFRAVREVADAARHRQVVYRDWGFGRRSAAGAGLKVLFAGPSGTGKTMTAAVVAADLGLDLYRIDLSAVVSKYIGETEKNLERVFRGAADASAILFFDEADALFGKRSEVKDAHDRYANIEVAYLLQRMEEYDGAVILASNLSRNIDEAFARRMHYVVEFPLPDEAHRARLWRALFPAEAPLGDDVDVAFLAKQFPLAGGDIRNVALDAAFLAAGDGRVITMRQVVRAVARQLAKQGRVPSPGDFKQYFGLVAETRPSDGLGA